MQSWREDSEQLQHSGLQCHGGRGWSLADWGKEAILLSFSDFRHREHVFCAQDKPRVHPQGCKQCCLSPEPQAQCGTSHPHLCPDPRLPTEGTEGAGPPPPTEFPPTSEQNPAQSWGLLAAQKSTR